MTPPNGLNRTWQPEWPIDLAAILSPLARGRFDPTLRIDGSTIWRTTRTPQGAAMIRYASSGASTSRTEVSITAWGPGARYELDASPAALGDLDDPAGFAWDAHPLMKRAHRKFGRGWRAPCTGRALEALVPAILEQRVTGEESRNAWARMVTRFGEPAPGSSGPQGLMVAPTAEQWAAVPTWEWHSAGVDQGRARTIQLAAKRASAIERLAKRPPSARLEALMSLPGIGQWTAAEVAIRAWGDIDAVSFGDFHLARIVIHSLTGREDGDDTQMAAALEPWAGQRARAVRMIKLCGTKPPRRGPRATVEDHRSR